MRISLKKNKKKKTILGSGFRFTEKLREQYRDFPPHFLVSPIINIFPYSATFITFDKPTL